MAKYRLHNRLGSGGFAIESTLAVAGIAFDYEPIRSTPNEAASVHVNGLNSWGQLPVLEVENATPLTEVAAILTYLSQAEPTVGQGPNLWIDDVPAFHRWTVFLAVNVYEGILRRSYTSRYFATHPSIRPVWKRNFDRFLDFKWHKL